MSLPNSFASTARPHAYAGDVPFGDSYDMVRELGRGGMAIVYLVRERATGIERAVKVIHTKYLGDEEAVARFDREARLVGRLKHPNIVATHSVRWIDGLGLGLVMDHVQGRTLKQILKDGPPLSFEQAKSTLNDIASALGYAHERGIVHRDVKPENIFIDEISGRAVLADFGIARSVQGETQLTMAGVAIGTPTYMAPEQIDGTAVDARSDLYSLGLVGWEMLTGRRPWDGETLYNVIYHQKHDQLAAIDALRAETPPRLVYAIEGLLEKSPTTRWQTAEQFRTELNSTEPPLPRKREVAPAPDETIAIAITPPVRQSGVARRLALPGLLIVALLAVVLLFVWPSPILGPLVQPRSAIPAGAPQIARPQAPVLPNSVVTAGGTSAVDSLSATAATQTDSTGSLLTLPPATTTALSRVAPVVGGDTALGAGARRVRDNTKKPTPSPARKASVAAPATSPPVAASVAPAPAIFTVAAGGAHTCLIASTGTTYCWGANGSGQLGDGSTQAVAKPTAVVANVRFASIAAGLSHTCARTSSGSVYCWGDNDHGQLGDGGRDASDTPTRISLSQSLASVTSGSGFSCGLTGDGTAYCWGAGARGQLGNGAASDRMTPSRVSTSVSFAALDAGWNHICGLSDSGEAYCWGANNNGQLGDGTTADHAVPTAVRTDQRFTALSAGSGHTCGTTSAGAIYCWGDNSYGQLGDGTRSAHPTPVAVSSNEKFIAISAGSVHTCALSQSHYAWCWGRNTYGQLGDGSAVSRLSPVQVSGGHTFTTLKAFGSHTCGTTGSSDLFCWGYNLDGQLGDGTREHRLRPTYIEKPTL